MTDSLYRGEIKCERCGAVYTIRTEADRFRFWLCYKVVDRVTGARCWTLWKNKAPK